MSNFDKISNSSERLETLRHDVEYSIKLLQQSRHNKNLQTLAHEAIYKRISPRLMRAKRAGFGSHQNFVQDLEQVISVWQNEGLDGLPRLIFYGMLYATLRSMTINVTPEVLRIMAVLGQIERAVAYAETIPDPYQKVLAYQILGGGGEKTKKREEIDGVKRKLNRELIQRAFSASLRMDKKYVESKFWSVLASDLARVGDMEAALSCAQQIDQDEPYNRKNRTLENISVELALAGKRNEAFQVFEQLEDGHSKTKLLTDLVTALAKAGLIKDTLNTVMTIDKNEDVIESIARAWQVKRSWLQNAVNTAKETQDIEERTKAISEMSSIIEAIQQDILMEGRSEPNPYEVAKAAEKRVFRLIWLGRYDDALNIIRTIDINISRWLTTRIEFDFHVFLMGLLSLGRFEDVEYLIENEWTERSFSEIFPIWKNIYYKLGELINQGNLDKVFAAIEDIEPKERQADAMLLVGPQLARLGRIEDIADFYKKNTDDGHFDALAHQLATHLANQGMFMEAELLMGKIIDSSVRFRYVFEVAGSLISLGRHTEILPIIKRHERKISERLEDVAIIAENLAPEDRTTALEILELGLIDSEEVELTFEDRTEIFSFIAAAQIQNGNFEGAVEIAEHVAREKSDHYSEIVSISVAKSPTSDQAQRLLKKSLDFVESIPDDFGQTLHLERQTILNYLVGDLAKQHQFEHAITVISRMDENFWQKPLALAELAGRLASEDEERANSFLDAAVKMVRKLGQINQKESFGNIGRVLEMFMMPKNVQHFAKWGMLNPKAPFGTGIYGVEAGMSFIAAELLKAGWIKKSLEIAETLKDDSIRLQIRTYASIQAAEQGDSVEANKMLEGSDAANPKIDRLKDISALGNETFDRKIALRTTDFHRLLESGDIKGARKLAKDLIDRTDSDNMGKAFRILAAVLLANEFVDELLFLLESIPDELADKIEIQIACIGGFIDEEKYSVAEKIADSIKAKAWGKIFGTLIEIKKAGADDQERIHSNLLRYINSAMEIAQSTESDAIKSWLSMQAAKGLAMLREMKEVLSILYEIHNPDFRYHIMSELSARLIQRGLIENAHLVFREIREQKIRDAAVTRIFSEFADLDPKEAMHAFHIFLHDLIDAGFKSTCHAVSQVIPLAVRLAGPDRGAELIWDIYKEIIRVDSFWERPSTI